MPRLRNADALPAVGWRQVHVTATIDSPYATGADTIAVGAFEGERIAHDFGDDALQSMLDRGEAKPSLGHVAVTHAGNKRVIVVGLGKRAAADGARARLAAAAAHGRAEELGTRSLCWEVPHDVEGRYVGGLVEGTILHGYRFDRFRRPTETARAVHVEQLVVSAHHDLAATVAEAALIATSQNRVRDLANRPANDITPSTLAAYALELAAERPRISATILDEDEIRTSGMGGFAAVAQGSEEPGRLIRLDYAGADERSPLLALIGKAVTFDSGGLGLKPALKMHEMKFDMAGGAAVLEALATLADLEAPVRVSGIVGAAENMISGRSVKPGDIVTALDGTTVEINNTDAEGRLILGDCITYARRAGADRIVDIATLTGGIVTALGSWYAGYFSNHDGLARHLATCGERVGEPIWRMPLDERYAEMVRGRYAQLTNLSERREAQAITAAEFLHHFAGDEVAWAHLDIAGTAYDARDGVVADKGATGFGLRLLVELARTVDGFS